MVRPIGIFEQQPFLRCIKISFKIRLLKIKICKIYTPEVICTRVFLEIDLITVNNFDDVAEAEVTKEKIKVCK